MAATPTVVSLTFTSGHTSQYAYARSPLSARNVKATFYVASGWVDAGSNNSMSWYQLRDLYRDGNEIGGMGKDHKSLLDTSLDNAAKKAQVCDDKQRLATMGLDPQTFAYPQAAVDANARAIVKECGYLGARTIGGLSSTTAPYAETIPPADAYNLRTANLPTGAITLASLQNAVNAAASKGGGWLPISFNQVCRQGTSNYSTCMSTSKPIDDAVLGQFLDWVQASGQTGGAPADTSFRTVRSVLGAQEQPPLAVDKTTVSLTFNDGNVSQYRYARPVLNDKGLRASFYLSSAWLDKSFTATMAWWQVDELYRDGNEIGGMGRDHKDLTATYFSDPAEDSAYKRAQVCDDQKRLNEQGYDPRTFAYPTGAYNAAAQEIVKGCGYAAARASGGLSASGPVYAESLPPKTMYGIRTPSLGSSGAITLSELQNVVTSASSRGGGWVPVVFNQVCHSGSADYNSCMSSSRPIDAAVFAQFATWLANSGQSGGAPAGTSVQTVRDVLGLAAQPVLPPRPTAVSLTFDDGLLSQYAASRMMADHGMKGTFYINSGPVDKRESGTMSWAQILQMAADGHDVGGHTTDHVNLKQLPDYDSVYRQVCDDRLRLQNMGLNPVSFAYPFAAFDARAEEVVRLCGYQTGRTGGSVSSVGPLYAESVPPRNPFATRALGTTYNGPITLESLQDAVTAAASHGGGWVQMVFHEVCYAGSASFSACMSAYRPVSDTVLNDFLKWMDAAAPTATTVKSVAEVMGGGSTVPLLTVSTPDKDALVGETPTFTGTAAASGGDVNLTVYAGRYPTGTPVTKTMVAVDASGSWTSKASSALAAGTYTLTAQQTRSGLTGQSVPRTFRVGSTPAPVVTITAPTDGAALTTATPIVRGTAVGDSNTVTLEVYAGGTVSGTPVQSIVSTVAADGTWSAQLAKVADGAYTVQASQTDSTNRTGSSAPVTMSIDSTAPAVSIDSPVDGTTVRGTSLSVGGSAGAAPGDGTAVQLNVYSGTSASGSPVRTMSVSASSGSWSTNVEGLVGGTYTLQATQSDSLGNVGTSAPVQVTLVSGVTVTSVSPVAVGQGAIDRSLTISGSNFTDATTVAISGTGLTLGPITVLSSDKLTLTVSASATAPTGGRDVVVSVPGEGLATCTGCLTVSAAPRVTSLSRAVLGQGAQRAIVQINGSGFVTGATVTVSGGGVTASVTAVTSTALTSEFSVAPDAAVGPRDLLIVQPDGGRSVCAGCMSVSVGPRLTSVSPSSVARGTSTTVTLTGSDFQRNVKVDVTGTGVSVSKVTWISSTKVTLSVSATNRAAVGVRSLLITNPDLGTVSGALTIT
jgi:peptidoglycan/xylan/chitin deacetylase (PgdA/CDA1 family)